MPRSLFLHGLGCPVMVFLCLHDSTGREGFGDSRYQTKFSIENYLVSLNIKIQMKFHLKVVCKLYEKVRGTVFLAVHGKILCESSVLQEIMMF